MRKIIVSIFTMFTLICVSCSSDKFEMPGVTSKKYIPMTKSKGSSEIAAIYVKASNDAGGVNITLPVGENPEPIFIKNEELQGFLEMYIGMNSEVTDALKSVNYINFVSNGDLTLSYNDAKGSEMIIPDMLNSDGSFKSTLKYRMTYDKIAPRIIESLAMYLNFPAFGELPPQFYLSYKNTDDGMLIYADYTALNSYIALLPAFNVDQQIIDMISSILSQYNTTGDTIEIGIYLKKIK